ncbi:uDENN domain [Popillia japonica]|uniref:UDENN domain n=1 Tax=Popillia japonica TaxID=7064 RepID=A0AAW1NAT4_POPJA
MDEKRVADYFVIAGLPDDPDLLDENALSESGNLKSGHSQAPITDIGIVFPTLGEEVPEEYEMIQYTPTGLSADLNHGSLRSVECYICFRRGRDKPPLVDIGVMYEGKEYLMADAEVVKESVGQRIANVNNSTAHTFITYRRGQVSMPCNALVVTDICVVIASKGESPPHAFCCINKNLNKGIVGSDVFLCYKKSMNRSRLLTYKPAVLCRYPVGDLSHFPFPNSVPLFCLPMGASLELWPKEASQPRPVFSTFVLTVSDAKHKVYGSAVTFYENYPEDRLTDEQKELLGYDPQSDYELHVNKSICVLSHWPFSYTFEKWLMFLYETVSSGRPQMITVERYVIQMLDEVPFPGSRMLLQLTPEADYRIAMTQPEDLPLPRSAAGFKQLLLNLGSDNCLLILLLALTEQKILIHSLRPDTLTAVAEAVSTLLFPFKWQCPYIPLCPLGLVEVLHAPLPFLIGVDSRFFDLYDPPPDVSCVDLDTNIITVCETHRSLLNIKLLPKKAARTLKNTLDQLYTQLTKPLNSVRQEEDLEDIELEFQRRRKDQLQELEIQEAFLRFMAHTLKGYRSFLLPITKAPTVGTTDPQALFQLNEFLKSRDKNHHKFFSLLMHTQMFIRFIEERSFVADGDQSLAFFDECTEKLNNEDSVVRLLDCEVGSNSERTVFLMPPEPLTPGGSILYNEFMLSPNLLTSKRLNQFKSLYQHNIPGSPMAKRTKHEIKSAQKLARKCIRSPKLWHAIIKHRKRKDYPSTSLYFMALPSMLSLNIGKERIILQQAYDLLARATSQKLTCDEVCYRLMMQLCGEFSRPLLAVKLLLLMEKNDIQPCYRLMMQLCGEFSRPLLAVKLLLLMEKNDIQPNALTYGLYNRCVLEAEWPAQSSPSQLLWNKLRYVVVAAGHFRYAGRRRAAGKLSTSTEGDTNLLDTADRAASRSSLDSHETVQSEGIFDKFRTHIASIVKGANTNGSATSELDSGVTQINLDSDEVDPGDTTEEPIKVQPESPSEYLRILSRSESAGDANIIDKLQQNNKKNCSRSLQFNGEKENEQVDNKDSPTKTSPRTLVTENDPLGALDQPIEEIPSQPDLPPPISSATFEGSPPTQNKLHRSETVPAAMVTSGFASIGSSIKMLSRYSPARLSLRKANLKSTHQLIENAINNLSPSNLTGKKSNELIQGGISSLKSAATTVVKKLDEIKEAISTSTTSTPVKMLTGDRLAAGDVAEGENESTDGSEGGERHRRISAEFGSYRGSYANLKDFEDLPENLFPTPNEFPTDSDMDIALTSCSQCHNCLSFLYDEDIMSNWSAEDSNLNTVCQSCNKPTVPLLTITITQRDVGTCEPFSVPYLNPLVLRKELENVLAREGDLSLAEAKFVEEHPIIYWNLVWAFERINVQTHLPNLCLKIRAASKTASNYNLNSTDVMDQVSNDSGAGDSEESGGNYNLNSTDVMDQVSNDSGAGDSEESGGMQPVEEGADPLTQELASVEHLVAPVTVRCMWDHPKLYGDITPMYTLYQKRNKDQSNVQRMMKSIIDSVHCNDLLDPLKKLALERQRNQKHPTEGNISCVSQSIYRDILFLTCKAVGRSNIDPNVFDKEYATAFSRISERNNKLYGPQDRPLTVGSVFCRQYFKPLLLP